MHDCEGFAANLIDPAIAAHHGRIVKRTGDGSIIEFGSVRGLGGDLPSAAEYHRGGFHEQAF